MEDLGGRTTSNQLSLPFVVSLHFKCTASSLPISPPLPALFPLVLYSCSPISITQTSPPIYSSTSHLLSIPLTSPFLTSLSLPILFLTSSSSSTSFSILPTPLPPHRSPASHLRARLPRENIIASHLYNVWFSLVVRHRDLPKCLEIDRCAAPRSGAIWRIWRSEKTERHFYTNTENLLCRLYTEWCPSAIKLADYGNFCRFSFIGLT